MMYDCFQTAFQISGAILALVLAAGQLALRKKTASNYYYAAAFISISVWSGIFAINGFKTPSMFKPAFLDIISQTAYSFTAVLFYFLMQSVLNLSFRLSGVMYLFFLPGILTFLFLSAVYFFYESFFYSVKILTSSVLYIFSISVYLLILYQVNTLRRLSADREKRGAILKIMIFLSAAAIFTIIPQFTYMKAEDIYSVTVLVVLFYIVTMRYPESFIMLREEAEKARYAKSKISGIDVNRVKENLERRMLDEKLFLKCDLTLNELAASTGVTPHQLSEILNVYYKKNFYDFINFYRISEAKKIFTADKHTTALGICFEVGFNSNSAFYRAFKKETGTSPAKFRKTC